MLGAIFLVHLPHGFDVGKGGLLTQLLIALLLSDAGAYSIGPLRSTLSLTFELPACCSWYGG
jgi:hypothetical protein